MIGTSVMIVKLSALKSLKNRMASEMQDSVEEEAFHSIAARDVVNDCTVGCPKRSAPNIHGLKTGIIAVFCDLDQIPRTLLGAGPELRGVINSDGGFETSLE